jgi:hypothetical protein
MKDRGLGFIAVKVFRKPLLRRPKGNATEKVIFRVERETGVAVI